MINTHREVIEVEGVPVTSLAVASQCEDTQSDDELFTCVEEQFWRVLQRDFEQRKEVIATSDTTQESRFQNQLLEIVGTSKLALSF